MSPNPIPAPARPAPPAEPARRPYAAPSLEHLGTWSALTLQQSVPITFLSDAERTPKFG